MWPLIFWLLLMSNKTLKQWVTLENTKGLHARAAAKLVKISSSFEAEIYVRSGETIVSGRSIMDLLMLAAPKGTRLELSTSGQEAQPLMKALQDLISNGFYEES